MHTFSGPCASWTQCRARSRTAPCTHCIRGRQRPLPWTELVRRRPGKLDIPISFGIHKGPVYRADRNMVRACPFAFAAKVTVVRTDRLSVLIEDLPVLPRQLHSHDRHVLPEHAHIFHPGDRGRHVGIIESPFQCRLVGA